MSIYVCFGCHVTLGEDDTVSKFPAGSQAVGLCDECAEVGQLLSVRRRPRPCPCVHCVYWEKRAQEIA